MPVDTPKTDTVVGKKLWIGADTLKNDSVVKPSIVLVDSLKPDKTYRVASDSLESEIKYSAKDSIVYDVTNQIVKLYGKAEINYTDIKLNAAYIEYDWKESTLFAEGRRDSSGKISGKPVFTEGDQSSVADNISYNFRTKKGKAYHAVTKEGDGFVIIEQGKKDAENNWYASEAKYTTCDLDTPHFYIGVNRAKIIPDKLMVSGPAHLVIEDVPTPLYIPFGIFPLQKGQKSGILLPEYGESAAQGFFLRNGGYYFGFSEKIDLAVRGDIYSSGSWGGKLQSNYKKRYKYNGNMGFKYARTRSGEPESDNFRVINDFQINWRHTQDQKSRPNSDFSANVNAGTATYDKNYSVNAGNVLNNSFNSSIRYAYTFPGLPMNYSVSASQDQNLRTHRMNITAPVLAFNVNRISPFKRKISSSNKKWYEKIGLRYTLEAKNIISGIDSVLFNTDSLVNNSLQRHSNYGIRHNIPISSSINIGNFIFAEPSFNYTERWYFQSVKKNWNGEEIITDTLNGFNAVRDFNASFSFRTTLYGMYNFKSKWFKAMRHVITPTISFQYHPDFGTDQWNYYDDVQSDTDGTLTRFSFYEKRIYGVPASGKYGGIGFNLYNNFEAKVFSKKDSVHHEKKIKLLERFSIGTFYNIAADSLNLSPITLSATNTFFEKLNVSFNSQFDPYIVDSNNKRFDTFELEKNNRLARLTSATASVGANFSSKRNAPLQTDAGTDEEQEQVLDTYNQYLDFNVPWNVSIRYSLNMRKGTGLDADTTVYTQSLDLNLDFNLTPKWKVALYSGYDFKNKDFTYTTVDVVRDLHCWELSFHWVPYPIERQTYLVQINVKSPVLQDLKLSKKKSGIENVF